MTPEIQPTNNYHIAKSNEVKMHLHIAPFIKLVFVFSSIIMFHLTIINTCSQDLTKDSTLVPLNMKAIVKENEKPVAIRTVEIDPAVNYITINAGINDRRVFSAVEDLRQLGAKSLYGAKTKTVTMPNGKTRSFVYDIENATGFIVIAETDHGTKSYYYKTY